jgi:hypothetical protein
MRQILLMGRVDTVSLSNSCLIAGSWSHGIAPSLFQTRAAEDHAALCATAKEAADASAAQCAAALKAATSELAELKDVVAYVLFAHAIIF